VSHFNFYENNAQTLSARYDSLNPDKLYSNWLQYLPSPPGLALDIGGGSGRDALWLAQKGWEVTVIEPSEAFLNIGRANLKTYPVRWVADRLPYLKNYTKRSPIFSFILVSAVFMHLNAPERAESFETLAGLLAKNGLLVITLRMTPWQDERKFYFVPAQEIVQLATSTNYTAEILEPSEDQFCRKGVIWQTVVVKNIVNK